MGMTRERDGQRASQALGPLRQDETGWSLVCESNSSTTRVQELPRGEEGPGGNAESLGPGE